MPPDSRKSTNNVKPLDFYNGKPFKEVSISKIKLDNLQVGVHLANTTNEGNVTVSSLLKK